MKTPLQYLTQDDQKLLAQNVTKSSVDKDAVILEEGSRRQALFLVREGAVRVERAHLGRGVSFARLGPGELFGEVSFLEQSGASASVIADEDGTVVDIIEGRDIQNLLSSVPGFGTRFYHSVALTLSERLRTASAMLPPLLVEDVPQVNRFHAPRSSAAMQAIIPPSLTKSVEDFKTAMMVADRSLTEKKKPDDATVQKMVNAACDAMHDSLRKHIEQEAHLEKGIGAYVFRETFSLFMLSTLIDRSFSKPRGYAGDFFTIEIVYEDKAEGGGRLGRFIDRWMRDIPASTAVRNRRPLLAAAIADELARWKEDEPMPIASLASGPAREVFDIFERGGAPVHATCIDIDGEALAFVAEQASKRGISDHLTLAQDNLIRLSRGRGKTALAPQQLMYSIGLIDYLQDDFVITLLDWVHATLRPGGTAIVGNFDVSNPNKAFMDHVLEWQLIHRTPADLKRLFASSKFGKAKVDVRAEDAGVNLFAFARKD